MSDLVGNPEDRFSHNEAHFISDKINQPTWCIQRTNDSSGLLSYLLPSTNEKNNIYKKEVRKRVYGINSAQKLH